MTKPLGTMNFMKTFIAGHSGLVGSSLVRMFESKPAAEIHTVGRTKLDLLNRDHVFSYLNDLKPELVIIAAAKVGGIKSNSTFPVDFLTQNIIMQTNLMDASFASNVKNVIFLGSSCIYPKHAEQPIKENSLLTGPLEVTNEAYAIAKIAGIELINSYRKEYGAKWISLMPTNLYGSRDNFDLQASHVLPALIRRFVEAVENGSTKVVLWGSGSPKREFLHVNDLARAVLKASENYDSSMHLNIGTGSDLTIKELAGKVAAAAGFTGEIDWDTSKPDGTPQKVLDVSKIKALGWEPTITLEAGIASTIAWYKEASARGEVRK